MPKENHVAPGRCCYCALPQYQNQGTGRGRYHFAPAITWSLSSLLTNKSNLKHFFSRLHFPHHKFLNAFRMGCRKVILWPIIIWAGCRTARGFQFFIELSPRTGGLIWPHRMQLPISNIQMQDCAHMSVARSPISVHASYFISYSVQRSSSASSQWKALGVRSSFA